MRGIPTERALLAEFRRRLQYIRDLKKCNCHYCQYEVIWQQYKLDVAMQALAVLDMAVT